MMIDFIKNLFRLSKFQARQENGFNQKPASPFRRLRLWGCGYGLAKLGGLTYQIMAVFLQTSILLFAI